MDLISNRAALGLRGKIGEVVIQGCPEGHGNATWDPEKRTLVRIHVVPTDPQTPAQLARRALHAAGTVAWKTMPSSAHIWWNARAAASRRTGYNLFMSHWLRGVPPVAGSVWDDGASSWDGGASLWDLEGP